MATPWLQTSPTGAMRRRLLMLSGLTLVLVTSAWLLVLADDLRNSPFWAPALCYSLLVLIRGGILPRYPGWIIEESRGKTRWV